jgi:hypothetical protein
MGSPPPRKKVPAWSSLSRALRRPPFERRACASCPPTSRRRCWRRRARAALTDRACECRNWHGARATSSVDGWASMALRSHVVEAAGVRSSQSAAELWSTARSAPACRTQSRLREQGEGDVPVTLRSMSPRRDQTQCRGRGGATEGQPRKRSLNPREFSAINAGPLILAQPRERGS